MQARYIPQYIQSDARVFKNCYLNFSYPRPAMKSVARASEKAGKDRRKKQAAVSDSSDDSDSGNDSRKKARNNERELLKAREEEKKLKRQLQEINAKNEEARAKLNEMQLAIAVMIIIIISLCSFSDAVYIAPGATVRDRASGFTECLHPW